MDFDCISCDGSLLSFFEVVEKVRESENRLKKKIRNCGSFFVARPGFEPRQTEPKSVVLPLYYQAISLSERKNREIIFDAKFSIQVD